MLPVHPAPHAFRHRYYHKGRVLCPPQAPPSIELYYLYSIMITSMHIHSSNHRKARAAATTDVVASMGRSGR